MGIGKCVVVSNTIQQSTGNDVVSSYGDIRDSGDASIVGFDVDTEK